MFIVDKIITICMSNHIYAVLLQNICSKAFYLLVFCVCSGFVRVRQQVYLIEPLGRSEDGDHAVYRQEHLNISGSPRCGSPPDTTTPYDQDHDQDQGPRLAGLFRSRSWVRDISVVLTKSSKK